MLEPIKPAPPVTRYFIFLLPFPVEYCESRTAKKKSMRGGIQISEERCVERMWIQSSRVRQSPHLRVLRRQSRTRAGSSHGSLILIAIGLLVNASPIVGLDLHTWRFEGVTQRIGICYFFASILELWSERRGEWTALVACLIGY